MIEWVVILALCAAVGVLWQRLARAEKRLENLDANQDRMFAMMRGLRDGDDREAPTAELTEQPEPEPTPAVPIKSVPKVRLTGARVQAPTDTPSPDIDWDGEDAEPAAEVPTNGESLRARRFSIDLEDVFGRRLPIWAGGVTLAVAGVFLVRYSIESGLLTPSVRVLMAFLFGLTLLACGEAAFRMRERVADPRVAQALAGAGLATLYAGFYLAGSQYGLVGQTIAFIGLALVTAGSIALSFRFGLPSAVLGLVGGFAAPALVGGDEANLPLLSLYLGLVTAGLAVSGRRQNRPWMGIAALVGGLGWGALLLLAGEPGFAEILALGLYFVILGAIVPALTGAEKWGRHLRLASALVASVQLALLVDQGGYSPLAWGLYLLLGATLAVFGWRNATLREANATAATVGVLLLAQWDAAAGGMFAVVSVVLIAIFALVPLALVWRGDGRRLDLLQLCGTVLGTGAVAYATFGSLEADRLEPLLAVTCAVLALVPGLAAWRSWRKGALELAAAMASAAALSFAAILMVTPAWCAPIMAASVFAGLSALLRERREKPLDNLLRATGCMALLSLPFAGTFLDEIGHLSGQQADTRSFTGLLRWLAVSLSFAALAWREDTGPVRRGAEAVAALIAYGAVAQVLPAEALAWAAVLLAGAIYHLRRARIAAILVALAIATLWVLPPLGQWLGSVIPSLAGDPVFANELPPMADVFLYMLPVTIGFLALRLPPIAGLPKQTSLQWLGLPLAIVIGHVLFKNGFAIETQTRFVATGIAERTLWQALLLAVAWIAATGIPKAGTLKPVAVALALLSLAHFVLYTGLLHNPLWDRQALGPVPVANLALAAYGIAVAAALSLRSWLGDRARVVADGVIMVLISVGALTLLRQAFAGSIAADAPMTQTEDLLRSMLGILLALFFLFLGNRLQQRSWKVGSLAIILIAVAKVFLVDAAGLEGLLRIASFVALGFSLIGIGWIYSRQT